MNAIALILLYALADRFAGGGWPWLDSKLPGRGVFWAALVCAGVGWLLIGLFGALAALAWLIWRTPGWNIFGGSMSPQNFKQLFGIGLRHLLGAPGFLLAALVSHMNLILSLIAGLGFIAVATALAEVLGQSVRQHAVAGTALGEENTFIELTRGAVFGGAVAVVGMMS